MNLSLSKFIGKKCKNISTLLLNAYYFEEGQQIFIKILSSLYLLITGREHGIEEAEGSFFRWICLDWLLVFAIYSKCESFSVDKKNSKKNYSKLYKSTFNFTEEQYIFNISKSQLSIFFFFSTIVKFYILIFQMQLLIWKVIHN